jgi:hypothetical protein
MNIKEGVRNACHRFQCKLQYDVSKKAKLDSECLCFDEFPERRLERNDAVHHHIFRGIDKGLSSSSSSKTSFKNRR